MFTVGIGELIIILLIAFLVVGPKDLPKIARTVAKAIKKVKLISEDLKEAINLDDEIDEVKEIKNSINKTIDDVNPVSDLKNEITDISKTVKAVDKDLKKLNIKK